MSLPRVYLIKGRDNDVAIDGPGVGTFDFSDYSATRFVCSALGLSKSSEDGAGVLELTDAGANILVHVLEADLSDQAPGPYEYVVDVKSGSKWFPVAGLTAQAILSAAP